MKNTLSLHIICFSLVKQIFNQDKLIIKLPAGSTGSDLEKYIIESANGRLDGIPIRLAVNKEFVSSDIILNDGDEIALIPPMQGG